MKWISKIILVSSILFTINPVFADDATTAPSKNSGFNNYNSVNQIANNKDLISTNANGRCAVVNYNGIDVVNPRSEVICKDDLSYSILEMVFTKIFNEWDIFTYFAERKGAVSGQSYSYSMGGPIISVLEAVSFLVLLCSGLVFSGVVIRTLNLSASNGQFMSDKNSVWTMLRLLFAMVLIVPIGSFSIAQVLVLVLALFATMLGNYVWGAFLSMQQANSLFYDEDQIKNVEDISLNNAETMVSTQLCSLRTASAIMEAKQQNVDDFRNHLTTNRMNSLIGCSRGSMLLQVSDGNGITEQTGSPMRKLEMTAPQTCGPIGVSDSDAWTANNEQGSDNYAKPFTCGEAVYSAPTLDDFMNLDSKMSGSSFIPQIFHETRGAIEDAMESIKDSEIDKKILKNVESAIGDGENNKKEVLDPIAKTLESKIYEQLLNVYEKGKEKTDTDGSPTQSVVYKGVTIAAQNIYSNLMGASYTYGRFSTLLSEIKANLNFSTLNAINIDSDEEKEIVNSPLFETARKSALYLLSANCAKNWGSYRVKYDSSMKFIEEANDEMLFSFVDGKLSSDCFVPVNMSENSFDSNIVEKVTSGNIDNNLVYLINGSDNAILLTLFGKNSDVSALKNIKNLKTNDAVQKVLATSGNAIYEYSLKEANKNIQAISAYMYVVRKASIDALTAIYQKEAKESSAKKKEQEEILIKMRERGWASAGGFILMIAKSSRNLSDDVNSIMSTASFRGQTLTDAGVEATVDQFLNRKKEGEENTAKAFLFNSITDTTGRIFKTGNFGNATKLNQYNEISISGIMDYIEDWLLEPTKYLKQVGGFSSEESLRKGVENCYKNGDCGISNVHPVVALMNMGNDLIDLSINILIMHTALDFLVNKMSTMGIGGNGSVENGGKLLSKLKTLIKGTTPVGWFFLIIEKIAEGVLLVLQILMYFVPGLFLVGVFFSFIVPMMPFIAFLMGFIGWLMLVLELLVAVNIWVVLMATPNTDGSSKADVRAVFNFTGQLLLKPALMIVALVFAWYLSSISIYFVNVTIFGALSPTTSGGMFGLLDILIFYIVYLVVVFVAIKHSFKMIEILPDKIFELLNINKMNDVRSESLGMERMVQIAAGKQIIDTAVGAAQKTTDRYKDRERIRQQIQDKKKDPSPNPKDEGNGENKPKENKGDDLIPTDSQNKTSEKPKTSPKSKDDDKL